MVSYEVGPAGGSRKACIPAGEPQHPEPVVESTAVPSLAIHPRP